MIYRREIYGLRELAVVPVILLHAGAEEFSGGFVGVVFFLRHQRLAEKNNDHSPNTPLASQVPSRY